MNAHLGLYYPFIHFRDEDWLKLTSPYWDRMGRIVPAEYGLRDSHTVRELKASDYVVDFRPGGDAQAETVRIFQDLIEVYGQSLVNRYGLHLASDWPDEPSTVHSKAAQFGNPKLAYVFSPKLSAGLIEDLVTLGLAERGGQYDPYWIGMHPRLAAVYMTALADAMATTRSAVPVSDDVLSHLGVGEATMDGMVAAMLGDDEVGAASTTRQAQVLMADVAISAVAPQNLENVSARKLIAFRQRYAAERAAFQDQVKSMVSNLTVETLAEPKALRDHVSVEYEKRLRPHIEDLKRRLRGAGIDTTTAIFNVKTNPAGVGAVTLELLDAPKPLVVAGAVALGVWGARREYQRTRRSILAENRAAAYLFHVHTDLSLEGLAGKIARLGQRFWG